MKTALNRYTLLANSAVKAKSVLSPATQPLIKAVTIGGTGLVGYALGENKLENLLNTLTPETPENYSLTESSVTENSENTENSKTVIKDSLSFSQNFMENDKLNLKSPVRKAYIAAELVRESELEIQNFNKTIEGTIRSLFKDKENLLLQQRLQRFICYKNNCNTDSPELQKILGTEYDLFRIFVNTNEIKLSSAERIQIWQEILEQNKKIIPISLKINMPQENNSIMYNFVKTKVLENLPVKMPSFLTKGDQNFIVNDQDKRDTIDLGTELLVKKPEISPSSEIIKTPDTFKFDLAALERAQNYLIQSVEEKQKFLDSIPEVNFGLQQSDPQEDLERALRYKRRLEKSAKYIAELHQLNLNILRPLQEEIMENKNNLALLMEKYKVFALNFQEECKLGIERCNERISTLKSAWERYENTRPGMIIKYGIPLLGLVFSAHKLGIGPVQIVKWLFTRDTFAQNITPPVTINMSNIPNIPNINNNNNGLLLGVLGFTLGLLRKLK